MIANWLLISTVLAGHELPTGVVERGLQVIVRSERLELRYQVGLNAETARDELKQLGVAVSQTQPVFPLLRKHWLDVLGRRLLVRLDGRLVHLQPLLAQDVRRHHARIEFVYETPLGPWQDRQRRLEIRDFNFRHRPGSCPMAIKARGEIVVDTEAPALLSRSGPSAAQLPQDPRNTAVPVSNNTGLTAWIGAPGAARPATTVSAWRLVLPLAIALLAVRTASVFSRKSWKEPRI